MHSRRSYGSPPAARRRVAFIAWGAVGGRSAEIAAALGGESYCLFPPSEGRRLPAPVRYVLGAGLTAGYLVRRRPRTIVVTNPPIFPALIVWLYSSSSRRRVTVALDSHPGSFGKQGDRVGALMVPVHRVLARRVAVCLVTSSEWVTQVEAWGGRGLVFHEAPGRWLPAPPRPLSGRPRVLFVSRFAPDEPVAAVVGAARLLPDIDFDVTGRLSDIPPDLIRSAPTNVRFVGFQPFDRYANLLQGADVVLTLTTEPTSVMRAAYEATYAAKVLVISDWPIGRLLFASAVHVANDEKSISGGLRDALDRHSELTASAAVGREMQMRRWRSQIGALCEALDIPPVLGPAE